MFNLKKIVSLTLAGVLFFSMNIHTFADTSDEIAAAQAEKAYAESSLANTQANISNLESKKAALESYLWELNAQYDELAATIEELSLEAAEKAEELKKIKEELEKAKVAQQEQYEAMKIRIVYMYENGGATMLETMLSSESIAEFLNKAENIAQINKYDRDMLKKYEELCKNIEEQEKKVEEETEAINVMMGEKAAAQQEVQNLVASTNASISAYASEISASQEEAAWLMSEISQANSNIALLQEQKAAEEAAAAQAAWEAANQENDSYDDSDYSDTSASDSYEESYDDSYNESYEESGDSSYDDSTSYEESAGSDTYEESSTSSSQGTYLGNFKLTAYCNCASCCGTAGNYTASGTMPAAGRTVAMAGVPFGTQLLINGTVYTVEDRGTAYGHVDIYHNSHSAALSFGLQYADVYQLN